MCFDHDSRPPGLPAEVPIAGAAAAERLELTSADGTRVSAALAQAPEAAPTGVVILPDVRGLYRFYVELAERFAEAGHSAIAMDYFGRTAGTGERGEDFDFWPHVAETRLPQVQADAAAGLAVLRERTGVRAAVTVGFCFGGSQSLMVATRPDLGFSGVIAFYGGLADRGEVMPSPIDRAGDMHGPILGLYGEADDHIPMAQVSELDQRLTAAGVEHEIYSYAGAPHSFFDRRFDEYADACEDAWRRMLGFLSDAGAPAS
ncbi:MAG TPA: dienelactone hydrolase family protein [Solirubrobacteraceae bacterium]|jgi:carboxymethylenebutenolidase|nr:dienelactone hydrolase family protein [Solirubrobacteraceae bacterium]